MLLEQLKDENLNEITDYQFVNKTGLDIKFCLSNFMIDINSVSNQAIGQEEVFSNIISLTADNSMIIASSKLQQLSQ